MYLTSLLGSDVPDEVTISGDGMTLQLVREEGNIWALQANGDLMVGSRDGFLIEKLNPDNPQAYEEKISEHLDLPVNLEDGQVELKQSSTIIEYERGENRIDFTIVHQGETEGEISVSWEAD
ncbi:MAG: hypothetical protein ACLFRP_04155 [Puniceicoccaceae bacterium]